MSNFLVGVYFYAKNDIHKKSRAIYNALDFLGDVGGLMDGLKIIGGVIMSFIGKGSLTRWLVSQLFYNSKPNAPEVRNTGESGGLDSPNSQH